MTVSPAGTAPTRSAPTSTALTSTTATPVGPFTVIVAPADDGNPDGATVLASGWTDDLSTLTPQIHPSLRPDAFTERAHIAGITDAVIAFHEGDLVAIDTVAVHQISAEFRSHAWDMLRTVQAGTVVTYTQYAALSGRPAAVRAAAGACAFNAAALFVPCHRVVRTDGTMGGFRWGLPVKQWLLEHEESAVRSDLQQPALPI